MMYSTRLLSLMTAIFVAGTIAPAMAEITVEGEVSPPGIDDGTASGVTVGGDFRQSGTGSITIDNGSDLTTSSPSPYGEIAPLSGSTGTVTVTGSGSTWRLEGTDTQTDGIGNFGDGAFLTVGRGGTGTFNITDGGKVTIDASGATLGRLIPGLSFPAGFQIGRNVGSNGIVNIDGAGSELKVISDFAYGRIGYRGHGKMNITNGGRLTFSGINSDLNVGIGAGTGVLNVKSGGQVFGPVFMDVGGAPGSTGIVNLDGPNSSITLKGACTPDCPDGFSFDNQGAFLTIGADEGTGFVNVTNGASIVIDSSEDVDAEHSGFSLGGSSILGPEGSGTLIVDGTNSQVLVKGKEAVFIVGRLENGQGTLHIRNGGSVVLANPDGLSAGFVADRLGASGTITIDGTDSYLDAGKFLGIGVDQDGNNAGHGVVRLSSNATLMADHVLVGSGGVLKGNGTVTSSTDGITQVIVDHGGIIDIGLSAGHLTIDGDLILEQGSFLLEALSSLDFDKITVTGDLKLLGGTINLLFGFRPDDNFLLDPFDVDGLVTIADAFKGLNAFAAPGSGAGGANFAMLIGEQRFEARIGTLAVPASGSFFLLLMGLSLLILIGYVRSPWGVAV